jgi:transposase
MSFAIALSDEQWELIADLFDPRGRRGAPASIPRRQMVDALLFLARTGCQWRYLPERYGAWTAVWAQWRRWRSNGVWAAAMTRLAAIVRVLHDREPIPSMVMVDAQTVRGARYGPRSISPADLVAGRSARSGRCSSRSWVCPSPRRRARLGRTTSWPPASSCVSGSMG